MEKVMRKKKIKSVLLPPSPQVVIGMMIYDAYNAQQKTDNRPRTILEAFNHAAAFIDGLEKNHIHFVYKNQVYKKRGSK